jgi:glucokinase
MIIGIDIGGTKCAVVAADDQGKMGRVIRFPTTKVHDTLAAIVAAVRELGPDGRQVFGIACGGPLDAKAGVVLSPPNLPDWDRIAICQLLQERFGGRAYLMNDANACALAEWQYGAGKGTHNMAFLTHGTGMGGGLILNGALYEGSSGDAGELGHVRLAENGPVGYHKAGSFEGFCSGSGIAQLAAGRLPGVDKPSAKDVAEAAERGVPEALAIMTESGRYLGRALAILIDIINPEVIVLGSIYTRSGHLLESAMRAELEREALPNALAACRIVPAALGENTGCMSAIAVAAYRAKDNA